MFAHWNPHQGVNPILRKATLEIPLLDSVLPTKGSAPMSFTRASVRRELDYSGLFVELLSGEVGFRGARRVRNLIATAAPTGFSNATAPTVAVAPPSQVPANTPVYKLTENSANSVHWANWGTAFLTINNLHLIEIYFKAAERTRVTFYTGGNVPGFAGRVNLLTGAIESGSNLAVQNCGDGWWRVCGQGTPNATGASLVYIQLATDAGVGTYTGDGASGVYACAPQVEDVAGQSNQSPSEYVSVGADNQNEVVNTDDPTNASWTMVGGVGSKSAVVGPDGRAGTACRVTVGASSTTLRIQGSGAVASGKKLSGSVWMRKISGTGTQITIDLNDAGASVVTLTADWQEFKVENVTHASAATKFIDLSASTATWTTGDTFEVWRPQFNYGATANPFSPVGNVYPFHGACVDGVKWFTRENPNTVVGNVVQEITGVAVPEIPYPQVLKGYTPFPAATNLLTYSGDLTNAAWTKAASVASIATYPPRLLKESLPSQLRDDSTAASIHGMFRNPTVTANTNYCAWLVVHTSGERFRGRIGFLDAATSSNGVICEFNARTGVTNAAAIGTGTLAGSGYIDVAKGWGIVYVSGKIDAATTAAQVQFLMADSAGNLVYDGDGVSRMILGHFQLESGTVPTNIIPTTTAAVTVAGDVLETSIAGFITDAAGATFAEIERFRLGVYSDVIGSSTGTYPLAIGIGNGPQISDSTTVTAGTSIVQFARHKLASSWGGAEKKIAKDGVVFSGAFDGTQGASGVLRIGGAGSPLHGAISFVRAWSSPLTNAELIALTRNGYVDQTINTLGWVDSPQISHDGRRLYFMYSRYDFAPLLIDGAGLADLVTTGPSRPWHVAIPHPSYDADVYCAYLRANGTVERVENLRFDPNYDDFSLQVGSAESSIMEVAATATLPKRIYYNANRVGDVPKLVYRQENADGSWTTETVSELSAVSSGGSGAGYIDDNAFVTDDRLALVFASNRPGGQGSHDLWLSLRAGPTDPWGAPTNAGTNINTAGHEDQVFLHPNGTDVFFTRDGGLYHCTRAGTTINNDDTLITFTGPALAGGIGEPSTDAAMNWLYFSYLELATKRIRIMRAPWTGSKTAWGTPVAVD